MHLNNLLSTSDNSPEQLIRIAGHAASYISKNDCKLVEELKSRAEEYNASDALTILNIYCFNNYWFNNSEREHNPEVWWINPIKQCYFYQLHKSSMCPVWIFLPNTQIIMKYLIFLYPLHKRYAGLLLLFYLLYKCLLWFCLCNSESIYCRTNHSKYILLKTHCFAVSYLLKCSTVRNLKQMLFSMRCNICFLVAENEK